MAAVLFALTFVPQVFTRAQNATPAPTNPSTPTVLAPAPIAVTPTAAPTNPPTSTVAVTPTAPPISDVTIDGSSIPQPILRLAADGFLSKNPATKIDIQVSGTDGGFERFCNGALDINMATKGITEAQASACATKGVQFVETLLGYDAAVIVTSKDAKPTCLATEDVSKLLAPNTAPFNNWQQVNTTLGDAKLGKVYAATNARALNLLVPLVAGNVLRTDIQYVETGAAALDKIAFETDAVALVSFSEYEEGIAQNKAVKALELKAPTTCGAPSLLNFELLRYPVSQPLYVYVALKSLDKKPVADFMGYLLGDGKEAVTTRGFAAANDTAYARGRTYLENKQAGRTFSRIQAVNIAADQQGQILLGGAAGAQPILKALAESFTPRYSRIQVQSTNFFGDAAGYQKLCNNALDIVSAGRLPNDAETAICKTNNIKTLSLTLGAEATAILINGKNTFAECLTLDQLSKLVGVESDGKVKKWSDVDPKFPATDLLVVAPADGNSATDLLLTKAVKGVGPLPRRDVTTSDDTAYRATGIGNVEGGLTWLRYSEYKKLTNVATSKLVKVDSGAGCVAPTDATILDGTYAISKRYTLQINQNAFQRPEVKAFVWYLLSEDGISILSQRADLIGLDKEAFTKARDTVLEAFNTPPTPIPTATPVGSAPIVPTLGLGLLPATTAIPTATPAK